ncbi:MAG: YCF48-related protein [Bacteroidales bacterium]|nr:YCF48-related protein [Bacteroidales bacterium]
MNTASLLSWKYSGYMIFFLIAFPLETMSQPCIVTAGYDKSINCSETTTLSAEVAWEIVNGPSWGQIRSIQFFDTQIGIVALGPGLYKTNDGGSTWQSLFNDPNGNFEDIFFVNSMSGYAISSSGLLAHTSDGGNTWVSIQTGKANMKCIYFTNIQTGFMAGALGKLFRTNDSGNTWIQINCGLTQIIRNITFTTPQKGYLVGHFGNSLSTQDGGNSWQPFSIPGVSSTTHLYTLNFVTPDTGFITGSQSVVYKTVDAGQHWTAKATPLPKSLESASFFNSRHGIVGGQNGCVFVTHDGCNSFSQMQGTGNELITSLYYNNWRSGWMGNQSGSLRKLINGFTTFQWFPIEGLDNPEAFTVTANPTHSTTYTVTATDPSGCSHSDSVYITVENHLEQYTYNVGVVCGNTTRLRAPEYFRNISVDTIPDDIRDFLVSDSLTWIYVNSLGRIRKTTNAGSTWNTVFQPYNNDGPRRLACNSENIMLGAGVNGFLIRSVNFGNTWQTISTPVNQYLSDIIFANPTTVYACGSNGTIIKSIDAGISWNSLASPISWDWLYINFQHPDTGYVYAPGILFRTDNGGNSWIQVFQDYNITTNISLSGSRHILLTAYDKVIKSNDYGTTWEQFYTPVNMYWSESCMILEGPKKWRLASSQWIYLTEDGGSSYYKYKISDIDNVYNRIYSLSPLKHVISGGYGQIYTQINCSYQWSPDSLVSEPNAQYTETTAIDDYSLTLSTTLDGVLCPSESFYNIHTLADTTHPIICKVSCDHSIQKNKIYWYCNSTNSIDSVILYRSFAGTGEFTRIGTEKYSQSGYFTDSLSLPENMQYDYKIGCIKHCKLSSQIGSPHSSILLTGRKVNNKNLIAWTPYHGYPVGQYLIYYGTNADQLSLIDSVSNELNTYTHNQATSNTHYYYISIVPVSPCLTGNFPESHSNLLNIDYSGLSQDTEPQKFKLHPNPCRNQLNIENTEQYACIYQLFDITGHKISQFHTQEKSFQINVENIQAGVYFLRIISNLHTMQMKFIKH